MPSTLTLSPDHSSQEGDFTWSKDVQGIILGSFFWGYLVTQIPSGWMANRLSAKRVFGYFMLMTAGATLLVPAGAMISYSVLVLLRIIAGIGQVHGGDTHSCTHARTHARTYAHGYARNYYIVTNIIYDVLGHVFTDRSTKSTCCFNRELPSLLYTRYGPNGQIRRSASALEAHTSIHSTASQSYFLNISLSV